MNQIFHARLQSVSFFIRGQNAFKPKLPWGSSTLWASSGNFWPSCPLLGSLTSWSYLSSLLLVHLPSCSKAQGHWAIKTAIQLLTHVPWEHGPPGKDHRKLLESTSCICSPAGWLMAPHLAFPLGDFGFFSLPLLQKRDHVDGELCRVMLPTWLLLPSSVMEAKGGCTCTSKLNVRLLSILPASAGSGC